MAFGVKIKSFTTNQDFTLEELFEKIKDKTFTAGQPSLTKQGVGYIITFPALDRNNQVWVLPKQLKQGDPCSKWQVSKNNEAGTGKQIGHMLASDLSGGWSGFSGTFGKTAKECEKLVETTCEELAALGL